jgi:hypothetical protein
MALLSQNLTGISQTIRTLQMIVGLLAEIWTKNLIYMRVFHIRAAVNEEKYQWRIKINEEFI